MPKYSWPELSPDSLPFLCFAYGDLSKSGDFLLSLFLNVRSLFLGLDFNGHFDWSGALSEDEQGPIMRAKNRPGQAGQQELPYQGIGIFNREHLLRLEWKKSIAKKCLNYQQAVFPTCFAPWLHNEDCWWELLELPGWGHTPARLHQNPWGHGVRLGYQDL